METTSRARQHGMPEGARVGTLVRNRSEVVSLCGLDEFFFGAGFAWIAVGMIHQRQASVGDLDSVLAAVRPTPRSS
jgi:hypothetical protein